MRVRRDAVATKNALTLQPMIAGLAGNAGPAAYELGAARMISRTVRPSSPPSIGLAT